MRICDICRNKLESFHKFINDSIQCLSEYQLIFENVESDEICVGFEALDQSMESDSACEDDQPICGEEEHLTILTDEGENSQTEDYILDSNNRNNELNDEFVDSTNHLPQTSKVECLDILPVYKGQLHTNNKKISCTRCTKTFKDEISYQAHSNWHKGLPAYSCKICASTFSTKYHYNNHIMKHNNIRQYVCHICAKAFITNSGLVTHINMHKDLRKFACDICNKRFRMASHLKTHRASHFSEKPFSCTLCEQKFTVCHTAKQHMKSVHLKLYPYDCPNCTKKFKRKHHLTVNSNLKNHNDGYLMNVHFLFRNI